jgi:thioredoxin reductase (NADPH)
VYERRVEEQPKITAYPSTDVLEIQGEEALMGVKAVHEVTREESVLPAAGVWLYTGLQPNTDLVVGLLTLNDTGHVPVDLWLRTSARGLFAAGDVRADSASQAVSSAGDGGTAAVAVHRYLELCGWHRGA